jgi:hypothetical protein
VLPSTTPDAPLRTSQDCVRLLAETISQVRRGEIDPKIANTIGYLGSLFVKALHETEIEKRLAALETAVKSQPVTSESILDEDQEHPAEVGENGKS